MFFVDCPCHDAPVLLGPESIVLIRNQPAGMEIDYRCACGRHGTWRPRRVASAAGF